MIFSLFSSSHSAWNSSSTCSLQQCYANPDTNSSCRSSVTPCFDYRMSNNNRYCAPGILCSILLPCNNGTCPSTSSICVVNSCCSPQAVCLPLFATNYCVIGNSGFFCDMSVNMNNKFICKSSDIEKSLK